MVEDGVSSLPSVGSGSDCKSLSPVQFLLFWEVFCLQDIEAKGLGR